MVMTRFPVRGGVKTRLEPALGADGAFELHSELARYCVHRMHATALSGLAELHVSADGGSAASVRRWLGHAVRVHPQFGADLGARLAYAARAALRDGAPAVVLVGSDTPDLGREQVSAALGLLASSDVVLGPATDGGYYLIAMNASVADRAVPALLELVTMPWGTSRVLDATLEAAAASGLSTALLEPLSDVDRPEDLTVWEQILAQEEQLRVQPRLSVVIPALNEAAEIASAVRGAHATGAIEVIVADGGSTDATVDIARKCGAMVVPSSRGRARQLNAGADHASGDVLIFLHADSRLPADALDHIGSALRGSGVVLGSFRFRAGDPARALDRLITSAGRLRQRVFKLPYGDMAPFLRHRDFDDLGGFLDVPVMEDYEFALRCKRLGLLRTAGADCVTSARAWHDHGLIRVTLVNARVIAGYRLGASFERLARWRAGILAPGPEKRPARM
ncbi:MAG: hypothetical protein CVT67_08690 [Actinobacteria bacterium HGW-Actinobacteria-7]|nr:MAG: hypothetical protein CVT67_08690 [Actinobacteria bacterium HGW-Actinobacteria-7]